MAEQTIFLKVLEFTPGELECLLKSAIKLLYIDGKADIEEWNLISLVPALLEVEVMNAPEEFKNKWNGKLEMATKTIREQNPLEAINALNIEKSITDKNKRETFIIILFMVAFADSKLTKLELNFILNNVARPWHYTKEDVVKVIKKNQNMVPMADQIIKLVMNSLI